MNDLLIFVFYLAIALSAYTSGRSAVLPVACVLAFVFLVVLREHRERTREDFMTQLRSFRHELRNGGTVVVDHLLVRYDTALTTYNLNVGFLIGSVQIPSPFRIYTGDAHYEPILYSLISLVTGWWALPPGGPLMTLSLVQRNLSGGDRTTVAMLIDAKLFSQPDEISSIFAPPELPVAAEVPFPTTGERSNSAKQMKRRTSEPTPPSMHERIRDMEAPVPIGIKLRESAQRRISKKQQEVRQSFEKTKETIKSKRLGRKTPTDNR